MPRARNRGPGSSHPGSSRRSQVNDLKELVCESLAAHAASCAELRKALDSGVGRAKVLAAEITSLRAEPPHPPEDAIGAPLMCAKCHGKAVAEASIFPCSHVFHVRCLSSPEAPCPLCSDEIIATITTPFISVDEDF